VVVDDPHDVDQAVSDKERTGAVEWWNDSMSTRLNDPSKGHKDRLILYELVLRPHGDLRLKANRSLTIAALIRAANVSERFRESP
jgi:hypothetical protein